VLLLLRKSNSGRKRGLELSQESSVQEREAALSLPPHAQR
jgi:hypothetical protein